MSPASNLAFSTPLGDDRYDAGFGLVPMRYQNVCLEAFGYTLPEEIVTSDQLEACLKPVYTRLRLPEGRLELMTGIRQRRFWPAGMLPSQQSIASAEKALAAARLDRGHVGALIHASVCRDYLEPATAASVHRGLRLSPDCLIYDVSNACLGILNGIVQLANMIELGQVRAGVVVGTEDSRQLVETTVARLNRDTSLARDDVKLAMASLTIGSASVAVVLTDRQTSRTGNRLLAAVGRANTEYNDLCRSGHDDAAGGELRPLMRTDSERLMHAGIETAAQAFPAFLDEVGWSAGQIDKTFCHQVGAAHRKLLFQALGLDAGLDYTTLEYLGNTGSVALPITAAIGVEQGRLAKDDRVAMLGIGSGINVLMLGVDWQRSPLESNRDLAGPHAEAQSRTRPARAGGPCLTGASRGGSARGQSS